MRFLLSTILIIASIGIFYLGIDPAYQEVKALQAEKSDYNTALANSSHLRQVRNDLVAKYNSLSKDDIDRVQKLLPDSVDNIRLILDINSIASKYGMSIKNIKISQSDGGASAPGGSANPVGSIQLSFSVTTSYENYLQFIQDLESSLRVVDMTNLSFTSTDKNNINDYNMTLVTYWLK